MDLLNVSGGRMRPFIEWGLRLSNQSAVFQIGVSTLGTLKFVYDNGCRPSRGKRYFLHKFPMYSDNWLLQNVHLIRVPKITFVA